LQKKYALASIGVVNRSESSGGLPRYRRALLIELVQGIMYAAIDSEALQVSHQGINSDFDLYSSILGESSDSPGSFQEFESLFGSLPG
jgi:hypothetical protein